MKIALTNMDIIWEDKSVNQDKCLKLIKRASECGARLIRFSGDDTDRIYDESAKIRREGWRRFGDSQIF